MMTTEITTPLILALMLQNGYCNVVTFEDDYAKEGTEDKLIGIDADKVADQFYEILINDGFVPVDILAGYSIEHGPVPKIGRTVFLRKCTKASAQYLVRKPTQEMIDDGFMDAAFDYNHCVLLNRDQHVSFDLGSSRQYDQVFKNLKSESNLVQSVFTRTFVSRNPAGTVSHYRRAA